MELSVLYSVDYTEAIDNFNECEQWAATEWMTRENNVMEGILHMKSRYKETGLKFECFHNRGHLETYLPKESGRLQRPGACCGSIR